MATEEPIVAVEPVPEPTIAAEPPASEIDHSEPKAAEEEKKTKKAAKESKPKKASKPRNPASHPTYEEVRFNFNSLFPNSSFCYDFSFNWI
jgi:histone H1/5